jgi:hypothetical protein
VPRYDGTAVSTAPADRHQRARATRRVVELAAVAIAIGLILALLAAYFERGFIPGDAFTYLAAGERLNAGHPLYELGPGDRPVVMEPPFWTVPLLSPPPIAVAWRPLAALPAELGVYLWWALQVAAIVVAVGLLLRRQPLLTALAVIALSIPIVYEIGVGNLNGLILLGLVLAWRQTAFEDERGSGILVGLLAAFKLTPAMLGWWLLTTRRWSAVRWAIATGLVVLTVSVVGAGIDAHVRYLGIVTETASQGARPLSLAGIASYLGVPAAIADRLPMVALATGFLAIALLRDRPDLGFVIAVLTLVFGSPTVSINWFIYLLACLAPVAWPLPRPTQEASAPLPSRAPVS